MKRKLPFACVILDSEAVEVRNPFSGASCMLEPDAVAVYDCISLNLWPLSTWAEISRKAFIFTYSG